MSGSETPSVHPEVDHKSGDTDSDKWVPKTRGGSSCYHNSKNCQMLANTAEIRSPRQNEIGGRGLTACQYCYGTREYNEGRMEEGIECPKCEVVVRSIPLHTPKCDGDPDVWVGPDGRYHPDRECDRLTDDVRPEIYTHIGGRPRDKTTVPGCPECSEWHIHNDVPRPAGADE